jgi:flagellar hook protein FlgE
MTVDQNGIISGTFTNGQVIALAQVALSSFNNQNGLVQSGNNHWGQSLASGAPTIGLANQGGRGSVLGANLELSNVDVAGEFTKLILSQRGYEANSKIVTTTDQLMQVTLNLKQ